MRTILDTLLIAVALHAFHLDGSVPLVMVVTASWTAYTVVRVQKNRRTAKRVKEQAAKIYAAATAIRQTRAEHNNLMREAAAIRTAAQTVQQSAQMLKTRLQAIELRSQEGQPTDDIDFADMPSVSAIKQ